ncbi:MAG: DNA translocase FtsK 4TM domain-containing protein [Bacteroidetes bacterium]|uniref:DNA translocase FtsK 4TM domain-containing protein n=1 Tax=Candidatus Caccoplasma merdipullorum TaxID=2840718 RepID=A0A9D9H4I2_9BACT|nr:DNA translocase FtsK 4TM domain-containing protein [Candidatus Caccoplasma merdipullorum]
MARRRDLPKNNNLIGKIRTYTKHERVVFSTGILLILTSVYILICLISFFVTGGADQSEIATNTGIATGVSNNISNWGGMFGARLSNLLINRWMGIASFLICPFLAMCGMSLMKLKHYSFGRLLSLTCASMIIISLFCGFFFVNGYDDSYVFLGGMHGYYATQLLEANIGWSGTLLFILGAILIFAIVVFNNATDFLRKLFSGEYWKKKVLAPDDCDDMSPLRESTDNASETTDEWDTSKKEIVMNSGKQADKSEEDEEETHTEDTSEEEEEENSVIPTDDKNDKEPGEVAFTVNRITEEELAKKRVNDLGDYDPTLDLAHYNMPTFDLLDQSSVNELTIDNEEQNANKQRIIETLNNYGIKISSIKATVGPTVTLYEIIPEPGVRIAKIRNLEDDIALSLSALGIRIIAPIPGKGTIGIEVPNKDAKIVSMYSVIASRKFQESKYDLPIGLGRTISNEVFMIDLAKMPHVLVAGATGQGKSVGLNAIITSLLYKKHPSQLKFVLIDPKKVEFNIYAGIERHFLAKLPDHDDAIVTDIPKVVQTLKSVTKEMDNRYSLLQKAHARNIKEYNAKFISRQLSPLNGHYYMPYIVVIVDEFGDLIMTAGKEIELPIARIAQLARAVGIHMIIATQRPSTNIITGIIKANFPARIAFKVSAMVDSKTILDCSGANQLIGRGDMLFSQGSDLIRVQCAFVDTPEIENICGYIEKQQGYPEAYMLPEYIEEGNGSSTADVNLKDRDELFEEAARLIVTEQQGSTSLLQRKFSLGYNRSGRIMDQLEAAGIVGPSEGSKPRKVLVMDLLQLDDILNNLK